MCGAPASATGRRALTLASLVCLARTLASTCLTGALISLAWSMTLLLTLALASMPALNTAFLVTVVGRATVVISIVVGRANILGMPRFLLHCRLTLRTFVD